MTTPDAPPRNLATELEAVKDSEESRSPASPFFKLKPDSKPPPAKRPRLAPVGDGVVAAHVVDYLKYEADQSQELARLEAHAHQTLVKMLFEAVVEIHKCKFQANGHETNDPAIAVRLAEAEARLGEIDQETTVKTVKYLHDVVDETRRNRLDHYARLAASRKAFFNKHLHNAPTPVDLETVPISRNTLPSE